MGLVQVNTTTISSGTESAITVDGIDSDDIYVVVGSGLHIAVDTAYLYVRVTKDVGGTTTAQSSAEYDFACREYMTSGSFGSFSYGDRVNMYFGNSPLGNGTGENSNIYYTLYNFNNSSEYSYMTVSENVFNSTDSSSHGAQGGFSYRVNEAHNGISIIGDSTTLNGGRLTLYKVV